MVSSSGFVGRAGAGSALTGLGGCDLIGAWPEAPSLSCPRARPVRAARAGCSERTAMSTVAQEVTEVTGGVDTHRDTHTAAALDGAGRLLGCAEFPATEPGYAALLRWLREWGQLVLVGVEGTGTYGAGLTRYLATEEVASGRTPPAALSRDHRAGRTDRTARARHQPRPAHPARHRTRRRRADPGHRRREHRPTRLRSRLRRALRRRAPARQLRTHPPTPPQPRRRPPSQRRALPRRPLPPALGPPHPRLPATTHHRRTHQKRNHPLPQTLHRPRDLPRPPPPWTSTGASPGRSPG
ncbi:transposase [Saccharopolyspora erythraea NRRL 2338]|nr:transposase [Saccharopolyspora erythraea NRRL 2338]